MGSATPSREDPCRAAQIREMVEERVEFERFTVPSFMGGVLTFVLSIYMAVVANKGAKSAVEQARTAGVGVDTG